MNPSEAIRKLKKMFPEGAKVYVSAMLDYTYYGSVDGSMKKECRIYAADYKTGEVDHLFNITAPSFEECFDKIGE